MQEYSQNEKKLALDCGVEESILEKLRPSDLYRLMLEKVFIENQQGQHTCVLRRVYKAWRYTNIFRGSPEFEALFPVQSMDVAIKFSLDAEQSKKLSKWVAEQHQLAAKMQGREKPYYGAIGGAVSVSFTATGLGDVIIAKHALTNNTIDLSDYESW